MARVAAAAIAAVLILSATVAEAQSLRGSANTMQRQNLVAREHDYTFLQTSAQVRRFVDSGYLVLLRGNADYELAGVSHPVARPAVRLFVERLAAQYRAACGEQLVVTSLTRPVLEQPRNASDLSVHPTGMAIDLRISRKSSCVRWLEKTLLSLEQQGVLDVTRESRPPHYHVALFPKPYQRYVAALTAPARRESAPAEPAAAESRNARPSAFASASLAGSLGGLTSQRVSAVSTSTSTVSADAGSDASADDASGPQLAESERHEEVQQYRVNRGDSLWSIARRHNTTVDTLKTLNSLKGTRIVAGQVITVPVVSGADES